jgi:hypothetical protein
MKDIACNDCSRSQDTSGKSCPPRMSDGRQFTDYRPRCVANYISDANTNFAAANSYEYRQYLIEHGESIMLENKRSAYIKNRCGPCVEPFDDGTMLGEQTEIKCNQSSCTFATKDVNGLGMGRQFVTVPQNPSDDFASMYSSLKGIEQTTTTCCKEKDPLYYGLGQLQNSCGNMRPTNPGGAVPVCADSM